MKQNTTRVNLIIHVFALAHALTAVVLRVLGMDDSIMLTILTIVMIIIISRVFALPLDVTAALTLVCCFAGFYLGTFGAQMLTDIFSIEAPVVVSAVTTACVTEILGWITYFIANNRSNGSKN